MHFIRCPGIAFNMGLQVVQVLAHSPYTLFLYCIGTDRLRGAVSYRLFAKRDDKGRDSSQDGVRSEPGSAILLICSVQ